MLKKVWDAGAGAALERARNAMCDRMADSPSDSSRQRWQSVWRTCRSSSIGLFFISEFCASAHQNVLKKRLRSSMFC